ncbi:MAG: ATP synthase F1 subunit gamma [SAR324 cluster bacterium]|nr:ATP synthase F1 subunit gamma [SAR324 cluster bacterium]
MSKLKEIRLRISSIKNTQQITRAMKVVSASKLRKAQQNIENIRPYSLALKEMVHRLYDTLEAKDSIFFDKENNKGDKKKRAVVMVITTDKGLCGSLNVNIFKEIPKLVKEELKENYDNFSFAVFGKKGYEYLKRHDYVIDCNYADLGDALQRKEVLNYVIHFLKDYKEGKLDALYVMYNSYKSIIQRETVVSQILPIKIQKSKEPAQDKISGQYLYEPNPKEILNNLVPLYVENIALEILFDNVASEHSARMVAMDAATNNAGDILKRLLLQFNRARQASITKELIEIISGVESIN